MLQSRPRRRTTGTAAVPVHRSQTRPGVVLGPGHASAVKDGAGEDWLAYHAWDPARTARRFCLDRLAWGPDGPGPSGPSTDARPAPAPASSGE